MLPSSDSLFRLLLASIVIPPLTARSLIKGFRFPKTRRADPGPRGRGQGNRGFAVVAALLAVWILTGLGVLVFIVSTRDVRVSTRVVGEKKAFASAEAGIHRLTQNFDPFDPSLGVLDLTNVPVYSPIDPDSRFSIDTPSRASSGPVTVPLPGYAMGGGQTWGQDRYVTRVTGSNTRHGSRVTIDVGIGYGPVEISTAYR